MNNFDESQHRRAHDGKFVSKPVDEVAGGMSALGGPAGNPPRRKGKKKPKNPHATANPELAQAMRELRRSSAASPHTPKPRKGTRGSKDRKAIREDQG